MGCRKAPRDLYDEGRFGDLVKIFKEKRILATNERLVTRIIMDSYISSLFVKISVHSWLSFTTKCSNSRF